MFGGCVNEPVEGASFPAPLQTFAFGYEFNLLLPGLYFPESLLTLVFVGMFSQPLQGVNFTASLLVLAFGFTFTRALQGVASLHVCCRGRLEGPASTAAGLNFPASLQTFRLRCDFNQPLESVNFPAFLHTLASR
jgi:hypothetical protein